VNSGEERKTSNLKQVKALVTRDILAELTRHRRE